MTATKRNRRFALGLSLSTCALLGLGRCVPTQDGFSGVTSSGGGGNNARSVENLAPADFAATPNSPTQINLTWTDKSLGQETFVIERSTDGTTFTQLATPAAGETSYSDTGLTTGVTYSYRLRGNLAGLTSSSRAASSIVAAPSIWTRMTGAPSLARGTQLLLSNGTVMVQSQGVSKNWYLLTPDSTGSYLNGTWSTISSMGLERLYFASNILPSGKMFVLGGEYSGPSGTQNWINSGEIYDPVANTWSAIATLPHSMFGDDPSQVLEDGRVLCGSINDAQTFLYDPTANSWTTGPTKLQGDRSDEETWVKLPDESILSYNIFGDGPGGQRYVPSLNSWVDAGVVPVQLENSQSELGPALLLPNAKVLFLGATGHTALYTGPTTKTGAGTWVAGPDIPHSLGANDAPAAELPNGHIILAAGNNSSFTTPTEIFDYDPTANTMTQVTTPAAMNLSGAVAYNTRMLLLPTGEILFAGATGTWIYSSYGQANPSWKPKIASISNNGGGVFTITGTQLNGMSEGSTYGDDVENTTNFPIVKIIGADGKVRFARSYNWSSQGVQTGAKEVTTQFSLPAAITAGSGTYSLYVIGSGISSDVFNFTP